MDRHDTPEPAGGDRVLGFLDERAADQQRQAGLFRGLRQTSGFLWLGFDTPALAHRCRSAAVHPSRTLSARLWIGGSGLPVAATAEVVGAFFLNRKAEAAAPDLQPAARYLADADLVIAGATCPGQDAGVTARRLHSIAKALQ
jgi:hypothetical protein